MNIKYADKNSNYKEKAREIWKENFTDTEEEINFYFDNIYKDENFLILEDKEKNILSSLHANKYFFSLNKEVFKTSYIVGVASPIIYRKKGYMKQLMLNFLNEADKNLTPLVFLSAINPNIYRGFSFEYFSSIEKYSFNIFQLSEIKNVNDFEYFDVNILNFKLFLEDLKNIYDYNMRNFFCFLKRDDIYFTKLLKEHFSENGKIILIKDKNCSKGYILYHLNENKISVREIFSKNIDVKKALLKILYSYKDYYENVEIYSSTFSNLDFLFDNQLKIRKNIECFMMGRITNLKEFIKLLKMKADLKIYIVDNIIKENNVVYDFNENKFYDNLDFDFKIDISDFLALALGFFSVDEMFDMNKIEIKSLNKLNEIKQVFYKKNNYLFEFL